MKFQIENKFELRPYVEKDAEMLFAKVKANFEHLQPFLHWVTPEYSLTSAKLFIEESQKASAENLRQGYGVFYEGNLIGSIGFINFSWNSKRTEIGYWIAKDFEGQGVIRQLSKISCLFQMF